MPDPSLPIATEPVRRIKPAELAAALREREPVVIEGALASWPQWKSWNFDTFRQRYGSLPIKAYVNLPAESALYERPAGDFFREMTVASFLDHLASPERTLPCYLATQPVDVFPGLREELSFGELLPPEERGSLHPYVWIGSENTRIGLHWDKEDNVLTQVVGSKVVYVAAPDAARLYPHRDNFTESQIELEAPDFARFPRFREVRLREARLGPGDGLFLPSQWWHFVRSLEPSISINCWFYGRTVSFLDCVRMLNQCGADHWMHATRQFFVNGVLRRKPTKRFYSTFNSGQLLLSVLVSDIERLVTGQNKS